MLVSFKMWGIKIRSDCYCGKASSKSEMKEEEEEKKIKAPGEHGVALGCEGANEHCCLLIAALFS